MNTTSLGQHGQPPLEIDIGLLPEGAVVSDIVYVPLVTPLLAAATARGLRTADGLGMLVEQAAEAFLLWRNGNSGLTNCRQYVAQADSARNLGGR